MEEAIPVILYEIEHNPEPEQTGTININLITDRPVDVDPILTRSIISRSLLAKEFIEDAESPGKEDVHNFLTEARVDDSDATSLMQKLIRLAIQVTSSVEYCPHYALSIWLTLDPVPSSKEGSVLLDDSQFDEVIRASLDDYETNIGFRPASKLGVKSLSKRIYKKKRKMTSSLITTDQCTICLEEFQTGRKVVTLSCGHEFDNKCIKKWFKVSHFCPLCRSELPCEDDEIFQTTKVF